MKSTQIKIHRLIKEEVNKEIKRQKYLKEGILITENGEIIEGFFSKLFAGIKGGAQAAGQTQTAQNVQSTANKISNKISNKAAEYKAKIADIAKTVSADAKLIYNNYKDAKQQQAIKEIQMGLQKDINTFFTTTGQKYAAMLTKNNLGIDVLEMAFNSQIQISTAAFLTDISNQMKQSTTQPNAQPAMTESYKRRNNKRY